MVPLSYVIFHQINSTYGEVGWLFQDRWIGLEVSRSWSALHPVTDLHKRLLFFVLRPQDSGLPN
ncbi:hypothetical protein TMatcc_000576 [Talaromyces marneffei ATCC 18224]